TNFLSRAGASGSHDLPWALPRVLQPAVKIKRRIGEQPCAAPGAAGVCSRAASNSFIRNRCASVIAVSPAGRRRGAGRGGKRSRDTAALPVAKRNETGKADVTGSGSGPGKHQPQAPTAGPRG